MTEPRYPGRTDRFRISTSTLRTYLMCGIRWQFEQEERHRHATIAMILGNSVAFAAECDNRTKLAGGKAALAELVDAGVTRFEDEVEQCEVPGSRFEIASGKDDAASASRAYGEFLSPHIEPVLAEEKVIAVVADGIELAGTIDAAEADSIRDLKTGRAWTQKRADESRQLTAYSMLFEARMGRVPSRVAIDSLSKNRRGWKAETLWSQRTERDRVAFIETVQRAKAAMEAGIALPAPEGAWWCSEAYCPWWSRCTARPSR